jgi:hypothetical protein
MRRIFSIGNIFGNKYKRLFADEHIVELAERLTKAKAACLALLEKPYAGDKKFRNEAARDEGNLFVTSARLSVYYTIDREDRDYRHHISIAYSGGVLALSGGQHFAGILNELLHLDLLSRASMWQSKRTVFHITFALNAGEQDRFANDPVHIPALDELPAVRARAREMVGQMRERSAPILNR